MAAKRGERNPRQLTDNALLHLSRQRLSKKPSPSAERCRCQPEGVSPRIYRSAAYASAAGYGSGSYSGYGCPASNYWVPYGTNSSAPYGIYASSYAIACERLKSGYAAPYGPIFY